MRARPNPQSYLRYSWLIPTTRPSPPRSSKNHVILTALGEEHESQRSTIDVAWHVPVSAWADHGPSRATFHQYTHGTLRAPGGRDERHFFSCARCDLESSQIAATCNDGGIRDGPLWHLCELADHSSRCRFRYSRRVSYCSRRTQRETLARNSSHCRISERQHFNRGRNCPCSLGASGKNGAGLRRLWMNAIAPGPGLAPTAILAP